MVEGEGRCDGGLGGLKGGQQASWNAQQQQLPSGEQDQELEKSGELRVS